MNTPTKGAFWRRHIVRLVPLVALCTLAGCGLAQEIQARQLQGLQNTCAAYGAGPGMPGYTDCMIRLHSEEVAQAIQAQRNSRPVYAQPPPNPYVPYIGSMGSPQLSFTCQRIGTFTYCN